MLMRFLSILLVSAHFLVSPVSSCECGIEKVSERIINGVKSPEGMFPWIVYITRNVGDGSSIKYCTGSIISDRHVLTAGHCYKPQEETLSGVYVWLFQGCGRRRKTHTNTPLRVSRIHTHPDYRPHATGTLSQDDIAVIELSQPLRKFMPICFSRHAFNQTRQITNLVASGWGKTAEGEEIVHSDCLQHTDVDIISDTQCFKHWGRNRNMRKLLCAGGSTTTCDGDSGGPLMTRKDGRVFEVGVTSFGRQDCGFKTGTPSGFERISFHLDWINRITGQRICFK